MYSLVKTVRRGCSHVLGRIIEMGLKLLKSNGLFAQAADGKLLFFATPNARSAYIVPDCHREDALRTLSRYWGLCEILSVVIIAPIALHFGALGLLAAFVVFGLGSSIAYRFALQGLLSDLETVIHEPIAKELQVLGLGNCLRTVADETHAGLLWLCEAVSILPLAGAILMVLNGHRWHHFIGGFLAIVFFGSASVAGAYMISMKHRGATVSRTRAFAKSSAAIGG